jgi:hypothetical protein
MDRGRYPDVAGRVPSGESMANGVFDQRLNDERWDEQITRLRSDGGIDRQPVCEASAMDVQVGLQGREFGGNADFRFFALDGEPHDGRELSEEPGCDRGRLVGQLDDGAEAVEEEMRVELFLQRCQSCARDLRFEDETSPPTTNETVVEEQ